MKTISCIIPVILILLSGCSREKEIIYLFENNKGMFKYQTTYPDSVIMDSINFWTTELTPGIVPFGINFIYSETTPNVEKLKSIIVTLSAPDEKGIYKEVPGESELDIEYYDGQHLVEYHTKNNTTPLNSLVDWKKVNYSYTFLDKEYQKKNNNVNFTYSFDYNPEEYPEYFKMNVVITWENGERKYETLLKKKEYTPAQFNPHF